jgi:hypothetical protein
MLKLLNSTSQVLGLIPNENEFLDPKHRLKPDPVAVTVCGVGPAFTSDCVTLV